MDCQFPPQSPPASERSWHTVERVIFHTSSTSTAMPYRLEKSLLGVSIEYRNHASSGAVNTNSSIVAVAPAASSAKPPACTCSRASSTPVGSSIRSLPTSPEPTMPYSVDIAVRISASAAAGSAGCSPASGSAGGGGVHDSWNSGSSQVPTPSEPRMTGSAPPSKATSKLGVGLAQYVWPSSVTGSGACPGPVNTAMPFCGATASVAPSAKVTRTVVTSSGACTTTNHCGERSLPPSSIDDTARPLNGSANQGTAPTSTTPLPLIDTRS